MSGATPINGLVTPELEDAPADIEVAVGVPLNQIDVLLNPVFTSPAQRDSTITAPTFGMESACSSTGEKYFYTGTQWVGMRPRSKLKETNQTTVANTVLVADDSLFITLEANSRYELKFFVGFLTSTLAGLKYQFTVPSGSSGVYDCYVRSEASVYEGRLSRQWSVSPLTLSSPDPISYIASFEGFISTSITAGTIQFYWAQGVSDGSTITTVYANSSYVWAQKLEI